MTSIKKSLSAKAKRHNIPFYLLLGNLLAIGTYLSTNSEDTKLTD